MASARVPGRVSFGAEPREQPLVAAVDAVKVADRDKSARARAGKSRTFSIVITGILPRCSSPWLRPTGRRASQGVTIGKRHYRLTRTRRSMLRTALMPWPALARSGPPGDNSTASTSLR